MANSKKRCKHCRSYFPAESMFIAPIGTFCSHDHAIKWTKEAQKKQREKDQQWRESLPKNTRELNRRDRKKQEDKTQAAFNQMRVLQEKIWFAERGIEPYCISCLKTNMDWCCGHYTSRGASKRLQFDELNTYLQCNANCNSAKSANKEGTRNEIGYTAGIIHRFGESKGQKIIDYCTSNYAPVERTWQEYEAMRKQFNAEIRRLRPILEGYQ